MKWQKERGNSPKHNRKVSVLKKELLQIKTSEVPQGHKHEEKVWEVKENLRKKIRRETNSAHSLSRSRRPSLRRPSASGTNFTDIGLELLTQDFFLK